MLDVTLSQHDEIQRLRGNVRELMPYLQRQGIYTSLNHVASGINGPLTAAHLAAVLPWVDGLEVINGTRLKSQNRTAICLAAATGKHTLGGGDSHTGRGIGLTWTEVPGATTPEEFMQGLRTGRGIAGGAQGGPRKMMAPFVHFIHEQRFNRDLLYDLIAKPQGVARLVPELAA